LLFFPSVGYEAKSLSFGNKLHDLKMSQNFSISRLFSKNYKFRRIINMI
jgi:hypothetical protein